MKLFKSLFTSNVFIIFYTFFFNKKNQLRILHYHDIMCFEELRFKDQLLHISKNWKFITPIEFDQIIENKLDISCNKVLLTFDDGFFSNRIIAEKYLNKLNIKAIFFVVPDYINIPSVDHDNFYKSHFYPNHKNSEIPKCSGNMSWDDLDFLLRSGHEIGFHTKSHLRLSSLDSQGLISEIDNGLNILENKLQKKIKYFSYPFGDISSINNNSYNYIFPKFDYIFTGIRGDNSESKFKKGLYRDVIQVYDTNNFIDSFLLGIFDLKYLLDKIRIKKLIKQNE